MDNVAFWGKIWTETSYGNLSFETILLLLPKWDSVTPWKFVHFHRATLWTKNKRFSFVPKSFCFLGCCFGGKFFSQRKKGEKACTENWLRSQFMISWRWLIQPWLSHCQKMIKQNFQTHFSVLFWKKKRSILWRVDDVAFLGKKYEPKSRTET